MCLLNFKEFVQIKESSPLIGFRIWRNKRDSLIIQAQYRNYNWSKIEGPHTIKKSNSGIYAYNYYNNDYNNNSNYYNNNNNYNNNYNYGKYNYYINGIVSQ
jgi:hypothetical protein